MDYIVHVYIVQINDMHTKNGLLHRMAIPIMTGSSGVL